MHAKLVLICNILRGFESRIYFCLVPTPRHALKKGLSGLEDSLRSSRKAEENFLQQFSKQKIKKAFQTKDKTWIDSSKQTTPSSWRIFVFFIIKLEDLR